LSGDNDCVTDPLAYEARYGWNRQSLRLIAICLGFCAVSFLSHELWLRILVLAFFGGGAVLMAYMSLSRRTAVRVDASGLTLCTSPLYAMSTTRKFPWDDIAKIVIWRGAASGRINRLEYVGVERRPGAAPLAGRFVGATSQSAAGLIAPGIPAEVSITGAATNGWVLDRDRLASAVAHFAPAVPVLDTTTGQYLTPAHP
jgi:hypothetical protein